MFEDTRQAKRAQTTRLVLFVPRYMFLFVSIMFSCTNWWFYIYTGSIYGSKAHEGIGWATIGKMGTNNTSGIVCAQLCVFFFFCAFCILTDVYRCYRCLQMLYTFWRHEKASGGWWQAKQAQTMRMTCCLGLRYVFFSYVFMYTNNIYIYIQVLPTY